MTTPPHPLTGATPATTWILDPARTTVAFRNKTFWGALTVKGAFSDVDGDAEVTAASTVSGRMRIGVASVSTGIGKRDEHLRSADFFDVERHPAIAVQVHGAKADGADRLTVDATLTVKEVSRRLDLPATVEMLDDGGVRIAAHTDVDRLEYGVDGNMVGMIPRTTRIEGVAVFTPRAATAS
jgi:polyisoprenoid-binding protein YceI